MKLRKLIKKLQKIEALHGDLDVFDADKPWALDTADVADDPENYPKEYKMPKKWVVLGF